MKRTACRLLVLFMVVVFITGCVELPDMLKAGKGADGKAADDGPGKAEAAGSKASTEGGGADSSSEGSDDNGASGGKKPKEREADDD